MKKREAQFASEFARWYKYNWSDTEPAYFEFKVAVNEALQYSALSEKQYYNLQIKKFYHKFSDYDRMGTPFDAVGFCGKGYVVIRYYYDNMRGNKDFYIIPIDTWTKEKETSGRKSLTLERAREIGRLGILA